MRVGIAVILFTAMCLVYSQKNGARFVCDDGKNISGYRFCDGFKGCKDGSDENWFDLELINTSIVCHGKAGKDAFPCMLPLRHRCDATENCLEGEDECLCDDQGTARFLDDKCFRCLSHPYTVLPIRKLCNRVIDCPDLSDECMCNMKDKPEICNRVHWDTKNGWNRYRTQSFSCISKKDLTTTIMIRENEICDKKLDCKDGIDQTNCTTIMNDKVVAPYRRIRCNDTTWSPRQVDAVACDGIPTCFVDIENEECNCSNKPLFCNYVGPYGGYPSVLRYKNAGNFFGPMVCNGIPNIHMTAEDEQGCPRRFYCQAGRAISIPDEKKCDQVAHCDDESDEFNCSFKCNASGSATFFDHNKACDGTLDCDDGRDECHPECIQSVFSDTKFMIKSDLVVGIALILSIAALAGNITVCALSTWQLSSKKRGGKSKIYHALILNLSISDLLVGVYTFAIIVRSFVDKGKYCIEDKKWRSGNICWRLGALLVIGSQESVLTMILITCFRMLVTFRPMQRPSTKPFWIALLVTWIVSTLLALIPTLEPLQDSFTASIWYRPNKLFSKIAWKQVSDLTDWLLLMHKNSNQTFQSSQYGSWSLLEELIKEMNPDLVVGRRFGYYSSHSVCLPQFFPDREIDNSWWYSLILVSINFVAFLLILIGYILMYRKATEKTVATQARQHKNSKTSSRMQRKLARIIFTDFCCWMPVCIMAFLRAGGVKIPNDTYLPIGLIVLPINSALNPLLYSDLPDIIWEKFKPVRSRSWALFLWVRKRSIGRCTETEDRKEISVELDDKPEGGVPLETLSKEVDRNAARVVKVRKEDPV